ncbi:MAG: DUF2752 domain-containing protein [Bacteroidales bacterium]|nr:DUF2752 domain-containing protein [Bacteroidales bacterium]
MESKIPLHPFCPFHRITGLPCPGCGGVRVIHALMAMDIKGALNINPLSVILCILIPVFLILSWVDYFKNTHMMHNIMAKIAHPIITFFIILVIIVNWFWNIYKGL